MNNESAATTKMMNEFYGIATQAPRMAALAALENAAQDKFAVVSFRVVPRGAFKWGDSRRGYYRLQVNKINRPLRINDARCISQASGPTGLESVGKRSAYCLDDSRSKLIAKAEKINAKARQDKWCKAMASFAAAMVAGNGLWNGLSTAPSQK